MRENRPYGSEGGEAKSLPYPYQRRLCPHELVPSIALRVQKCCEIAVVDPRRRGRGDRRLGVVGDAQAGMLDHAEVVGAVADRQRVDVVEDRRFR